MLIESACALFHVARKVVVKVEIVFKDGVGYDSQKLFDSDRGRYGQY